MRTTPTRWPTTQSTSSYLNRDRIRRAPAGLAADALTLRVARRAARAVWLGEALADTVIAQHRRRRRHVRRITLDLDLTEDPTHGAQQLALFNGFYGAWCYLPLVAFLTFDQEPRQYLVAALLRPGTAPAPVGVRGLLLRLLPKLWRAFPGAAIRVRLDGSFASPEMPRCWDAGVEYVVAMAKNPVLMAAAQASLVEARVVAHVRGTSRRSSPRPRTRRRRGRARRVVIKSEVVAHPGRDLRDDPRFVVTNLPDAPTIMCKSTPGVATASENRLKELHHAMAFGRTSCTRFWPNQLRVILSAAAYVLLQSLQQHADHTGLAHAQVARLRQALLTIGVRVVRSVRRSSCICHAVSQRRRPGATWPGASALRRLRS